MKRLMLCSFFIVCFVNVFSQSKELRYDNGVWQESRKLPAREVRVIMSGNENALKQYNGGKALDVVGKVIAYPCAFVFGYDLGGRVAGGKGSNTMLIVGAAGTAVGLLTSYLGTKKVKRSVELHNAGLNKEVSLRLDFGLTTDGVGLTLTF